MALNEYTVTVCKEYIYTTTIHADNWEDACDLAEAEFELDPQHFTEVDCSWEVVDYELINGEEKNEWTSNK